MKSSPWNGFSLSRMGPVRPWRLYMPIIAGSGLSHRAAIPLLSVPPAQCLLPANANTNALCKPPTLTLSPAPPISIFVIIIIITWPAQKPPCHAHNSHTPSRPSAVSRPPHARSAAPPPRSSTRRRTRSPPAQAADTYSSASDSHGRRRETPAGPPSAARSR